MEVMHRDEFGGNLVNILIVDDTPVNLRLLSELLTNKGYEVRAVTSGSMALTVIKAAPPELVLLDVRMPEMDGYEVCQQIKQDPETAEIPVIFISALDEVWDKIRAFSVGAVDYITKPFQVVEVLARVEAHLALRRLQRELRSQNLALQQEISERKQVESLLQREIRERKRVEMALQQAVQELQNLARQDGLTQVANRRCFDESLEQEWRRLAREQMPLTLILCDVDFFKRYNDACGHQAGDECLRMIANTIQATLKRPADLVARYGGEEFALILPNTLASNAVLVAEEIQAGVQRLKIEHPASDVSPYVTLSFGIACVIPTVGASPNWLIAAADQALYRAKAEGRDRIVLETELHPNATPVTVPETPC